MRGLPKRIATKQDYLNLIADGYDVREALQTLLNTARLPVDVQTYPKGYGEPGYAGKPLEPVWEEQLNRNGKIYRIGWTQKAVNELMAEEDKRWANS